jgi:hypothetical protein
MSYRYKYIIYYPCFIVQNNISRCPVIQHPCNLLCGCGINILLFIYIYYICLNNLLKANCSDEVKEKPESYLGCPRNKQFFVSIRTEKNRNSICFGPFCETNKIKFRFVSVFRNRFETNRNKKSAFRKQNETED